MTFRNLSTRICSSILTLGIVGSLIGLNAHPVAAESITITTPFPFCVNNQAYPKGRYRFTLVSQWILSIRDVNGEDERLFLVEPEADNSQRLSGGLAGSVSGVTFRIVRGLRQLQQVHEAGADVTFDLIGHTDSGGELRAGRPLQAKTCFTERSSISSRNVIGR